MAALWFISIVLQFFNKVLKVYEADNFKIAALFTIKTECKVSFWVCCSSSYCLNQGILLWIGAGMRLAWGFVALTSYSNHSSRKYWSLQHTEVGSYSEEDSWWVCTIKLQDHCKSISKYHNEPTTVGHKLTTVGHRNEDDAIKVEKKRHLCLFLQLISCLFCLFRICHHWHLCLFVLSIIFIAVRSIFTLSSLSLRSIVAPLWSVCGLLG